MSVPFSGIKTESCIIPSSSIQRDLTRFTQLAQKHGKSSWDGQWSTSQHPRCICLTIGVQISSHGHLWPRIQSRAKQIICGTAWWGQRLQVQTLQPKLSKLLSAMLGYPRIPHEQTSDCYHCIVLLASPLVNCHAGVNEFNTHIFSSPQHVTGVLIT